MTNKLTTDQKREYLRLLLTDGPAVALAYLDTVSGAAIMVFDSQKDWATYQQQPGSRVKIAIILTRGNEPDQPGE